VNVIAGEHPAQDVDIVLAAYLTTDVTHAQTYLTGQHLEPVLGGPDQMVSMVKHAVLAGVILHDRILLKMNLRPWLRFIFRRIRSYDDSSRGSASDWKSEGLLQSVDTKVDEVVETGEYNGTPINRSYKVTKNSVHTHYKVTITAYIAGFKDSHNEELVQEYDVSEEIGHIKF